MATNGQLSAQQERERLAVAASALLDRMQIATRLGFSYGGARDIYAALGWNKDPQWADYYGKYARQDIAGRIVDLPADATWREGFEIKDDDDPDKQTAFEKAWLDLDRRIRLTSWMGRLDRVAGIGEYAVLYLGFRGQPPEIPLRSSRPADLVHATVFAQPSADVDVLDPDPASERFGLPNVYTLTVAERTTAGAGASTVIGGGRRSGRSIKAHWSRIIHAAEAVEEMRVYGRPRLQRVFNLLDVLQLVVGSSGEAFWRGARPRYHLNVDKDFSGVLDQTTRDAMGDELTKLIHGFQDFIRTSGSDITQFMPSVGDPRGPAEVALDLVSAATGIPKRILLGSERGELASSQDAQEWAHRVHERQMSHAEPVIVRPLIDRLIAAGVLPPPTGGEYEVVWPDITGPSAEQRAMLAERIAKAEATHAQAEMLGNPIVTRNEFREIIGLPPVDEIDEDYPGQRAEEEAAEREAEAEAEAEAEIAPEDGQPPADEEDADPAAQARPFVDVTANASFARVVAAVNAASDAIFRSATVQAVKAALIDLWRRIFGRFGPDGVEPDFATREAAEFIRSYGAERVQGIGDETRRLLRQTLTEGLRAGETDRQLAARVRVYFRQASKGRARVIALTEAHNAVSYGMFAGMVQAGVTAKRWRTMGDERVRSTHRELDGQIRHIGDPFEIPSTGDQAMRPGGFAVAGENINCRCVPEPASNLPGNLAAAAEDEWSRRLAVHERRVLAGVRRAFREQQAAVLKALAE